MRGEVILPGVVEAIRAWQAGPYAHQPLTLTPMEDGQSLMAQVGGRAEMNAGELIEFLGVTRHAFYKRWARSIQRNGNGKYGLAAAMRLRDRIQSQLRD